MAAGRYAIVDNTNTVQNVVSWDGTSKWAVPANCSVVGPTAGAGPGDTYNPVTGQFTSSTGQNNGSVNPLTSTITQTAGTIGSTVGATKIVS